MICSRIKPAVSGLEQEFAGKAQGNNVDATTDTAREEVKALGFQNHGLVIRSGDGEVLWKQPDHEVKIEDVKEALTGLLES